MDSELREIITKQKEIELDVAKIDLKLHLLKTEKRSKDGKNY